MTEVIEVEPGDGSVTVDVIDDGTQAIDIITGSGEPGPPGPPGPGIDDGDKGDITVSASGSLWTIENGAITAAKTAPDVATQAELDALDARVDGLEAGGAWTLVVNESGASMTNWTLVAGSWSEGGDYIRQTNTGATYYGLKYTTPIHPGAGLAAQAEVRFPTAATLERRAMLGPCGAAVLSGTRDPWAGLGEQTDRTWIQLGDQQTSPVAFTVNEDQWYTIRIEAIGNVVSLTVDGVFKDSRRGTGAASSLTDASQFMLVNYTGEVHYRNIKVWRLNTPA